MIPDWAIDELIKFAERCGLEITENESIEILGSLIERESLVALDGKREELILLVDSSSVERYISNYCAEES
jgi:hypothetical protein